MVWPIQDTVFLCAIVEDRAGLAAAVTVTEPPWNGVCDDVVQPWLIDNNTKVRPVSQGRATWDDGVLYDVTLSVGHGGFEQSEMRDWGLLVATCSEWDAEYESGCLVTADEGLHDVC